GPPGGPGTDGTHGTKGTNGTNGTNGPNGTNGVSVTSATEPAGANCTYGGSKFTAADNAVTYACNGAPGTGGTGSGGPVAYAYIDHGAVDQSRTVGVVSMTPILIPGGSDIYCFDVAGTAANVIVNRALCSGNSGGVTATVSGLSGTGAIPSACPSGTDVAAISGVNGTSSFFMLVN